MSILVRKIREPLWGDCKDIKSNNFVRCYLRGHKYNSNADAITRCMNTFENTLSCWEIEDINHIRDAILALITGSKQGSLSSITYVLIPKDKVLKQGLKIVDSINDADTAALSLKQYHRNIIELDYSALGKIQDLIVDCIRNGNKERKTKNELWTILKEGLQNGMITPSLLEHDFQNAIVERYSELRSLFENNDNKASSSDV